MTEAESTAAVERLDWISTAYVESDECRELFQRTTVRKNDIKDLFKQAYNAATRRVLVTASGSRSTRGGD